MPTTHARANVVFLFADQMRYQATGFAGDPNVQTPYLDGLCCESINFQTAVSNCPICTPYRACLLTGQYPLTHGLFMNDLCLPDNGNSLAQIYRRAGYDTAYIGKWHLDGHGRSGHIPPERRQGFETWKVLECTHDYNRSAYYNQDETELSYWDGYDAQAQTEEACAWLRTRPEDDKPFVLVVSWGTPHNPYHTAPESYKERYPAEALQLTPNLDPALATPAREALQGYYAHITALDDCVRNIDATLHDMGLAEDTIFVFTSDHGDSVFTQCDPAVGNINKQRPYDESIRVPFLLRYPARLGRAGRPVTAPIATPDILPTLLELSGLAIPDTVEGISYAPDLLAGRAPEREGVLIANYSPFADWCLRRGGRVYRGVRTERYTYARTLEGAWLLFDNQLDPYQLQNQVGEARYRNAETALDMLLNRLLAEQKDAFLPAAELRTQYNYPAVNGSEAVPC